MTTLRHMTTLRDILSDLVDDTVKASGGQMSNDEKEKIVDEYIQMLYIHMHLYNI